MRIIDSHVHLEYHNPKMAVEMADHFGYEKFSLMGTPCQGDPLNTLESLPAKRAAPGSPKPISESGLNAYCEHLMPCLSKEDQKRTDALL